MFKLEMREFLRACLVRFSGDKVLGPDGFSMAFWQSSWGFVKEGVMRFFKEFYDHNYFVRSLNATCLVLTLKKGEQKT